MADPYTTKLSLRERIGFWLCHRAPWDLNYMTCGTPDKRGKHLWQAETYNPDDCPVCAAAAEIERLREIIRTRHYEAINE